MTYRGLIYEIEAPIAILTLNRPERRNALSLELIEELIQALTATGERSDVRAVILAAAGPAFCAGHDLSELVGRQPADYRRIFERCTRLMETIRAIPQPVIAEVQGVATAAGCQLVAACDLAVASENACFATPGVRIGLFCSTPMVPLVRAVGRKRAFQMLVTGEAIDARTAEAWGLINCVVPAAELRNQTRGLALRIAEASPLVIRVGKRAFYEQLDLPESQAYGQTCMTMVSSAMTEDAQEGITAFLEKRPPHWRGK